jgi:phosphatidate cytidylyltransferase
VAIPAAIFAVVIVTQGGEVFAAGALLLALIALHELYTLMRRARPIDLAGYMAVVAMVVLALYEERADVLIALVASFPVVFLLALTRTRLDNVAWGIAVTMFGILWIGLPFSHAVFLRELPHGDGLLIDVLVATFIGDTGAYLTGRAWGRHKLAPDISPNKTVEGLAGGLLAGTVAFWCAGLYQDWMTGPDALLLGFLVAITAPVGDLFESLIKRDMGTKDTGTLFGAHGGALDRVDAALFALVAGYYVWLAVA